MRLQRLFILALTIATLVLGVQSCANIVKPSGGDRDQKGPNVTLVEPQNKTLNFKGDEIKFYFNEFLKDGNYSSEVFISPVMETPPEVVVRNKLLIIRFREDLKPNTTYVLNIGKGIKDFNEGNEMAQPITYAFSTGNILDSLYFRGRIIDPWTGKGSKDVKLLLFVADSIVGNQIVDKKPLYVAESQEDGSFDFQFLKKQRYKIYGLIDSDNSYSYNQINEKLALLEDPIIDLGDSTFRQKNLEMILTATDEEGPELKSVKWMNSRTLHAVFKEKIKLKSDVFETRFFISDTLGENISEITDYQFIKGKPMDLLMNVSWPDSLPAEIRFANMIDSLGNTSDTVMRVFPTSKSDLADGEVFFAPKFDLQKQAFFFETTVPVDDFDDWDSTLVLLDTADVPQKIKLEFASAYRMLIRSDFETDPTISYQLQVRDGFQFRDFVLRDTVLKYKIKFPKHEDFGSVEGKIIPDSSDPADMNYIMILSKPGTKKGEVGFSLRIEGKREFVIDWLKPGKYKIVIIKDADGNGAWTPGSLDPYRLPEEIYVDPQPLEIRENWDLEGYTVTPTKKAKLSGGKGKGLKGTTEKLDDSDPGDEDETPKGEDEKPKEDE